jgi:hypothetical protein
VVTAAYGCTDEETIMVWVYNKLYLPNSFSPNGDGRNDVFRIPNNVPLELKEFSIYTAREQGFSPRKRSPGDGTGAPMVGFKTQAPCIYVVREKDSNGEVNMKGTVTLIR